MERSDFACRCIVCRRPVEEDGDKLCDRCAADIDLSGEHDGACRCGPCAVWDVAVRWTNGGPGRVWPVHFDEVRRVREKRQQSAVVSVEEHVLRRDAARLVVDVPGEESAFLLHALTTLASANAIRPGLTEAERAAWVRLCSARLEGV